MAHFSDILDQDQIKDHMQNAIKTGKLSHAYIISGESHSGKKMIANIFAKTILCENKVTAGDNIMSFLQTGRELFASGYKNRDT